MTATASLSPNASATVQSQLRSGQVTWLKTLAMLMQRSFTFLVFQALIALVFLISGNPSPWDASQSWWPVVAMLTNFVSVFLLHRLYKAEGSSYRETFRFTRGTVGRDILAVVIIGALCMPLATLPSQWAATAFFGSLDNAYAFFMRPLPLWAAVIALVGFPLTIGFAELPTYFGYVMPRLESLSGKRWLAVLLAVMGLALQHSFLPFVPDLRFFIWRAVMFFFFALLMGLALRWRPRLLPYLMIGHALIDLSAVLVIFFYSL